jgi:uncharacterized protein
VPARVVLDTNVVLSALVFTKGRLAHLRALWQRGVFVPVGSSESVQEIMRVLNYKKFRISSAEQQDLLADYLPFLEVVRHPQAAQYTDLPLCRDPKDQMFLSLAQSAKVDWLVTGDADLLALNNMINRPFSFGICTPQDFIAQLSR